MVQNLFFAQAQNRLMKTEGPGPDWMGPGVFWREPGNEELCIGLKKHGDLS